MPDTFQNASTSQQSSALPDNAAQCPDAQGPNVVRPTVRPSGLPIFSTEPLTESEKALLRLTARAHRVHADSIEAAVRVDRVDIALRAMHDLIELSERDAVTVRLLGSNR
jgi:hypothetical protein